jgi:hypothetical protein
MNIFVSSLDPVESAQALDTLRLNKMVLESAQLLSTNMTIRKVPGAPYRPTHMHHPCQVALDNPHNFTWLVSHFKALCEEYTYRTGKHHKCSQFLHLFERAKELDNFEENKLTLPNCTKFKENSLLTEGYKLALIDKWINDVRCPKWNGPANNRGMPKWASDNAMWLLFSKTSPSEPEPGENVLERFNLDFTETDYSELD